MSDGSAPVNRPAAAAGAAPLQGSGGTDARAMSAVQWSVGAAGGQPAPTDVGGPEAREQCGVFGIFGHPDAAALTYYGLYALQHRGQESAGIATANKGRIYVHKGMGLVSEVFNGRAAKDLPGDRAVGHVRYSTTGSSSVTNAQPLVVAFRQGELALVHNGNLTNAASLREDFEEEGSIFQTTTDTEVIPHLMARSGFRDLESSLVAALQTIKGAYALVFLTPETLAAARDPLGIRPLSLGRLGDAWVTASETCALDAVGAEYVRDVAPGEIVLIDEKGLRSLRFASEERTALCVFEFIYLARPDSDLMGANVHLVRKELGRLLAREHRAPGDVVIGVPDSSISAASGFAEETGIPYEMGLIKNRYVGRTFIQPTQQSRAAGVRLKYNPVKRVVAGKRVVLVDDSIVRGTTLRYLVQLLRDAGAREVHVRISSPPYRNPCYYGIDTSSKGELVAATRDVEQVREHIGADSLAYLSLDALAQAIGCRVDDFCAACFTGRYAVPPEEGAGKFALEGAAPGRKNVGE